MTHEKRWCLLMCAAIAVGVGMNFPLNVLQVGMCAFSLGMKIQKMMGARHE